MRLIYNRAIGTKSVLYAARRLSAGQVQSAYKARRTFFADRKSVTTELSPEASDKDEVAGVERLSAGEWNVHPCIHGDAEET